MNTSDVGSEGADVTYPIDNNRCLNFTNFLQNLSTRPILLFCLRRCVYDDKNGLVRGGKGGSGKEEASRQWTRFPLAKGEERGNLNLYGKTEDDDWFISWTLFLVSSLLYALWQR